MGRKLAPTSWKTLVKVFEADGFVIDRIEGSHISMVKAGMARPIVIQQGKEIPVFIIKCNMQTAGMSRDRYFALLDQVK
jgi:predicted RNA binding protein YcfA (HicA-like mRNA interferase family)